MLLKKCKWYKNITEIFLKVKIMSIICSTKCKRS